MTRKDGQRRMAESGRLMSRYAVQPLGGGSWGIYDKSAQKFTETFGGRGAMQKANRKWRAMVGAP